MKFNGVMLGSENPKRLGEFYEKIFGKPMWQDGDWWGFGIGDGYIMIGSHSEVKGKSQMPGRMIIMVETENVKEEFDRIKGLGAKVIAKPYQPMKDKSPDDWLATFADPDDNYFQLATPWKG